MIRDTREYVCCKERREAALKPAGSQLSVGARISHGAFGKGTIEGVDPDKGAYIIRFDNKPTPRMISMKIKLMPVE